MVGAIRIGMNNPRRRDLRARVTYPLLNVTVRDAPGTPGRRTKGEK